MAGNLCAEVALAAASGAKARTASPLRETLDELMAAAGLVRRIGTNLNQAVAKLNATGQRSDRSAARGGVLRRVIRGWRDGGQVRRSLP